MLEKIKDAVNTLRLKYPDREIYISVNQEMDKLIKEGTCDLPVEDYTLYSLYGAKYSVSPFISEKETPVYYIGLFNYAQILGQWNTFQDKRYTLEHLFTYETNYETNEEGQRDNDGDIE